MTIRTKSNYLEYIADILPDNTSRQISPADLRSAFTDLTDSVGVILGDTTLASKNFASEDTRTTIAGDLALSQISLAGRSSIDNSAFGYKSLNINYTGSRNTAVGSMTLACNSFGADNVAVGFNALGSNTVGSGNVAVGSYSLVENARGDFNIAIGHGAGYYIDDNSDFKFYLGVYPDASGGCDVTLQESGIPPLLYGDLSSRQLAVGTNIFVNDNVGLAVSGDILPASGQIFSLGREGYEWDASFRNVTIAGTIDVPLAWSFVLSDEFGSSGIIDKDDRIMISGVSGIDTFYFHEPVDGSRVMNISALPLSGWTSGNISRLDSDVVSISGEGGQLLSVSGQLDNVSGWILYNFDERIYPDLAAISGEGGITDSISGWADYNQNAISGFNGLLNELSGVDNGLIYQVSGWSRDEITAVSGLDGLLYKVSGNLGRYPDGLVYEVSGNIINYIGNQVFEAGSYTFWEIEDQFGASGQIHHSDTLVVSGVSGIETRMDIDEGAGGTSFYNLSISAAPISGWASGYIEQEVTASAVLISGFAARIASEEADDAYSLSVDDLTLVSGWAEYGFTALSGSTPSFGGQSGLIWNASGWTYGELLQISGWEPGRQVYDVSGYLKDYVDNQVFEAGSFTFWEFEDVAGRSGQVEHSDTVIFRGVSGINVEVGIDEGATDTNYRIDFSAEPISGYMESKFQDISGVNGFVSGLVLDAINVAVNQIDDIAGELDSSQNTALVENYFDPINADFVEISGKDGIIDQVSGWAGAYVEYSGALNSDYTFAVSGWAGSYINQQISNITFPDGQDQYVAWFANADSGPKQAVGPSKNVKYIGKDGIQTVIRNVAGINEIDFSALAITDDLTEISGVGGIIDQRIGSAGGDGLLCAWTISDNDSTSQVNCGNTVNFKGVSGISVYVEQDVNEVLISAEGVQSALDTLESRVDCLVNVNCPDTASECCDNVSGWALSNFTTLSGIDSTIYGVSGLIWSVSGQLAKKIDDKLVSSNAYDHWKISDISGPALEVDNTDQITFEGINGLTVTRDGGTMKIDGDPLSGVVIADLLAISGVGGIIDKRISDPNRGILGQANSFTRLELLKVSGVDNGTLSRVSGYFESVLLNEISGVDQNGLIYQVSGWNENYTYEVSGWANSNLVAISGNDGLIDTVSGYFADELIAISGEGGQIDTVSGWTKYNFDIIYQDLVDISGVGGLIDSVEANAYYGASGIELSTDNTFITAGSGYFDKIILSRRNDASDPSGQIVADTGVTPGIPAYHDIVNASGFLVVPTYGTLEGLKASTPAEPSNSGAIVFANGYPYQSQANRWSKPTMIEGFLLEDLDRPTSYSNPTSGRITVKNDLFANDYEEYVTNRDFFLAISGGLFCVAALVNGEYRPLYSSPSGCGE
jgi:hypothetical protein